MLDKNIDKILQLVNIQGQVFERMNEAKNRMMMDEVVRLGKLHEKLEKKLLALKNWNDESDIDVWPEDLNTID